MATLNLETIKLIGNGVLNANDVAVLLKADMKTREAAVDALQQTRVCAIIDDAKELLLKGNPETHDGLLEQGLQIAQAEHAEEFEHGGQFNHNGGKFIIEIKRTPRLVDEEGKPLRGKDFTEIRQIDQQKKELSAEQSRLTRERANKITTLMEKHPKLKVDITRTLKVKR